MVRKFDEKEKEMIINKLLEKGKEFFSNYGLKKTSVADLTKAAGIAQGSFYLFFDSKEELFLEVLVREEAEIRKQLADPLITSDRVSREMFKRFLQRAFGVMGENRLIRQLYEEDLIETLFRKLPAEKLQQHFDDDSDFLMPLILRGQEQGWLADQEPEIIVSLIRSIVLLSFKKREIGEERYADTIDLLIELVANGLIREEAARHD